MKVAALEREPTRLLKLAIMMENTYKLLGTQ
jgi:hypothetical protein